MARNIFANKKKDKSIFYSFALPLFAFVAVVILFVYSLGKMEANSHEQQRATLEGAINKSIIHSYATSGCYPPSLEYILDTYQIIYNTDIFYIDYQPLGSNIIPEVTIITLK